jgi:hypothetical protein
MRINWNQPGWVKPADYQKIQKYFKNRRQKCGQLRGLKFPDIATSESSPLGLALGVVWDSKDPSTKWTTEQGSNVTNPVVNTQIPPKEGNKKGTKRGRGNAVAIDPNPQGSSSYSTRSQRISKQPKHWEEEGFNTAAPLRATLSKEGDNAKQVDRISPTKKKSRKSSLPMQDLAAETSGGPDNTDYQDNAIAQSSSSSSSGIGIDHHQMSPIASLGDRHDAITELDTALQAASTILNEAMSELVATQQKVALCSSAFTEARDEVEQAQQRLIALGNDFKKAEEEHHQCIARLIEANGDVSHLRQLVVDTNKAFLDAANAEALKR